MFPPDPVAGYPEEAATTDGTPSGVLHLAFGAIGSFCLAAASFVVAAWSDQRTYAPLAQYSRISGAAVIIGFIGGAISGGLLPLVPPATQRLASRPRRRR